MLSLRKDFPLLLGANAPVYLDSAATSQKPQSVIDAEVDFYTNYNANIHRGVYALSQRATDAYEVVRAQVAGFMNALNHRNIVFTRSATEAFNLLANTISLNEGDIVLVSGMEHHANLVPWYMACQRAGAMLQPIPLTDEGEIDMVAFKGMLSSRVRVMAVAHVSNTLGTINPVAEMIRLARKHNIITVIDGAQAVMHMPVDMQDLDADAYIWTGHKCYGPTGTGVLYAKESLLSTLPPWQGGGDMIETVSFEKVTYRDHPERFEAGTPNIAGVIGLGAALTFLENIPWQDIQAHELTLKNYTLQRLRDVSGLRLLGTAHHRVPIFSFVLEGIHAHDVGTVFDSHNVCVRTGQHCAEPVMNRYGVAATTRISCGLYTSTADIDAAIDALYATIAMFR